MPEYEYVCQSETCNNAWCETHSIKDNAHTTCPACHQETAKRLISGGSGRGIVSLVGQDLVNKVKQDASSIESHASKNENFAANFLGDIYEKKQQQIETAKRDGVFRRSR
jgi:putative FmdB family regulatory protein